MRGEFLIDLLFQVLSSTEQEILAADDYVSTWRGLQSFLEDSASGWERVVQIFEAR